jgi:hypothetical protein
MTVTQLKILMDKLSDDTEVILSSDEEGNNYRKCFKFERGYWYDNSYYHEGWSAEDNCMDSKEFENTKGESDTLGGFIIEQAGRILKNNEFITCDNVKLIVESSDKRRIKMVKCVLPITEN